MKRLVICATTLALLAGCSALPPGHETHHRAGDAAASSTPPGYQRHMQAMQDMHRRMAAAKTPEERSALMKDHMKAMQDGMTMMGQMCGTSGANSECMGRRMDMMDMMMRMMMDRSQMMERSMPPK